MKLGDFGLSKVVGMQQAILDGKAAVLREEALGLQSDSIEKVRKFLPLKLDAAQREEQQAEATAHRTVKVLLITMDDSKADSTLLFINTTVEVSIADYDIDSDTIKLSQFEAIFIDGDYYEEDSPELVAHFCSHLFNGLPVLLCAKSEELRKRGLASGARACSRLPLEALTEDTFDSIFGSEQQVPAVDPLRDHLCDIAVLQEERLKLQLVQDSLHPSLDDKGFNRENSNTRAGADRRNDGSRNSFQQRNSVAVESRSHSLVGTLHFIAPEVIRLRRYGKAVDWWACGITIYECLVRKHVFGGEEKAQVFENIMNAPIVLDELAPFGEPVTALVRGLLNRDIKRRLGSGSQGAQAIKSHKLFEKIDWATVSTSNPVHKPAQFVNKKFRVDDRDLFYGPRGDHDASLRPEQLAERNSSSMAKYISNKKRARMSANNSKQSGSLKIGKLSGSHKNSGSGKLNDVAIRQRQRSGSGSRSFHKSQGSGSLEFVPEAPHEAHEEEDVRN
jgi:serine/threonine protein kinase